LWIPISPGALQYLSGPRALLLRLSGHSVKARRRPISAVGLH